MNPLRYPLWLLFVVILWVTCLSSARGQISPGPLSTPHAELEGSDQCLQCHSQKKRVSADLCFECHAALRKQVEQRRGFHSTVLEQGCERCHMEHHGSDFDLVYWGEEGEDAFDHGQAGFDLRGAHSKLGCRSCHKEALIRNRDFLRQGGKDLNRTFLGLDGKECTACHQDEHQGQFEDRGCDSCHGIEKWDEGILFEHEKTRYPLVGEHRDVVCGRCHSRVSTADPSTGSKGYIQFTGLPFSNCTDCHRDPHEKRLGTACQQCHSESGWKTPNAESFDHGRTRFALEGAHRRTRCESCHPKGLTVRLRFENCDDCHADHHLGQFANRPLGADCDSCHELQAFRPARYGVAAHQESQYPLEGAHLAVACDSCHTPLSRPEAQRIVRSAAVRSGDYTGQNVLRYSYPAIQCTICHETPHEESLARFMLEEDCLTCHEISGWRQIAFEHERTDYSLVGGHRRPGCSDCHRVSESTEEVLLLEFDGTSQECFACHKDPHLGQFAAEDDRTVCTNCHAFDEWQRLRFDHDRDSTFSLEGVHARVACGGCHRPLTEGGRRVVRYKPLRQECRDCHSGSSLGETGNSPSRGR